MADYATCIINDIQSDLDWHDGKRRFSATVDLFDVDSRLINAMSGYQKYALVPTEELNEALCKSSPIVIEPSFKIKKPDEFVGEDGGTW